MRARMSIIRAELICELREVDLKNRPNEMLEVSPKGTVPVLITAQQEIIEESLEIMQYARNWVLNEEEKYWVMRNDDEFKFSPSMTSKPQVQVVVVRCHLHQFIFVRQPIHII